MLARHAPAAAGRHPGRRTPQTVTRGPARVR
jgi:hypothetical protein